MEALGGSSQILVNATGLGSRLLGGVEDRSMVPARGQIALIRNDPGVMMAVSPGKNAEGFGYFMTRAAGGGTVMGGCYEVGSFEGGVDMELARRFMNTCIRFCPSLVKTGEGVEGLQVVRHGVGLRPVRNEGVRIERTTLGAGNVPLIHCYGHGGWGYQTSWATAELVVQLVKDIQWPMRAKI